MEIAALLISALALLVSAFSVRYSRQQSRSNAALARIGADRRAEEVARATAIQERAKHADVDVRLAPVEANSTEVLIVSNGGPAPASEVSVSFIHALSSGGVDGAFGEIAQRHFDLRPGDSEILRLSPDFDSAPRYEVAVRWTDLAGGHQKVRIIDHLR